MKYKNETLNVRESNYGSFADNADISQKLKAVVVTGKSWNTMTQSQKESLEMICTKISRILGGDPNYADNWHDIAGYAQLVEEQVKK